MNQITIYINYILFLLYKLLKTVIQLILAILQPFFFIIKVLGAFLPVKKRDDVVCTKISDCQKLLNNFLQEKELKKKYRIIWENQRNKEKKKAPNAHAAAFGRIVLTGDWTILNEESININGIQYRTIDYLYLTVGHELGHKDSEPFVCLFSNIQNYIREVRADFCGIQFAVYCGVERKVAIDTKYHLSEYYDKEYNASLSSINRYLDGHPSNLERKHYLDISDTFSENVVDAVILDFYKNEAHGFSKTPLCNTIKKKSISFRMLSGK